MNLRQTFKAFLAGLTLVLSTTSTLAQELTCSDGSEPRVTVDGTNNFSYVGAAKHIPIRFNTVPILDG